MIIVKGDLLDVKELKKAESVLFIDAGAYSYVESGIVENELRVHGNWETAGRPGQTAWFIVSEQGTEIPQELGDWLVAHQGLEDLEAKVLIVKRGDVEMFPFDSQPMLGSLIISTLEGAYLSGFEAAVMECGEILSRPLLDQDDNQTSDDIENEISPGERANVIHNNPHSETSRQYDDQAPNKPEQTED